VKKACKVALLGPFGDPHDLAGVVIGDDGQVAVPAPIGHLVDAKQPQAVQTARVKALGDNALDDRADGVPGDAHQPRDRRLGHLLSQKGHHVFEVARKARPARPRHRLDPDAAVRALHASQAHDHVTALGAQIEMAPATQDGVVRRPADLPAA
jgi:hypothetical protein